MSSDSDYQAIAFCSVHYHLHLASGSFVLLVTTVHGQDKSLSALLFPHTQHCGRTTAWYRLNYKVAA